MKGKMLSNTESALNKFFCSFEKEDLLTMFYYYEPVQSYLTQGGKFDHKHVIS